MRATSTMTHSPISDPASILAWLGGIFTAGFGAVGLWLANRLMGKAAFQQAINTGFKELLAQVNADRERLASELRQEKAEAEAERYRLATALEQKELAAAAERAQLRGEILNLTQVVESLKTLLRANGIKIPERHKTGPVPSMIVLGEEFRQDDDGE